LVNFATSKRTQRVRITTLKHSNVLDVPSYRAADTDLCLVLAEVRERLAVNKQRSHRFHMQRFSVKRLNEVEVKEVYRVEV
jgi:hypothetical protein